MSAPQLKPGWRVVKFGDIAQNVAERIDPAQADTDVYVGLEHLDPSTIHLREWGHPSDVTGQKLVFEKGDVIFGRRRAYQRKLAVADRDGICSAHAMVVRAKPKMILPDFLPFFLQSDTFMERAINISVGSLSPTVNWTTLKVQEFPLPPIEEQKRIAEILWAVDDVRSKINATIDAANKTLAAIRSHEICSKKYPWGKFKKIIKDILAGKSLIGINEPARKNEYGVLKVSAVSTNGFVNEENKKLKDQKLFKEKYSVHKDDLLITRCNTADLVGMVCIVDKNYANLMLCDKTLRIYLDEKISNKLFVFEALRSKRLKEQIKGCATGTSGSMKNISQQDIYNLMLPLPDIETQNTVAMRIEKIQTQIALLLVLKESFGLLSKQLLNN